MNRVLSILMLVVILSPSFMKVYIVIDFKISQDFIAKELCVKKEVENNTCQGTCHLKKELKKVEEQEQKQTPLESIKKIKEIQLFSEQFRKYTFHGIHNNKQKLNSSYTFSFSEEYLSSIFHPPKV
jgi:hypothetical protein